MDRITSAKNAIKQSKAENRTVKIDLAEISLSELTGLLIQMGYDYDFVQTAQYCYDVWAWTEADEAPKTSVRIELSREL